MLTTDDIALVRMSFVRVAPIQDAAADIFYDRLFAIAPNLRALFPVDLRALELLAFALVQSLSRYLPSIWGQIEQSTQNTTEAPQGERLNGPVRRKIVTVCVTLIVASTFMQTADAQQSRRSLPNDPEQFRMVEECLELTFGRSGGKETARMYEACLDRQLASQRK